MSGVLIAVACVALGGPAWGQAGGDEPAGKEAAASGIATNKELDPDPDAPSPAVTRPPAEADFFVIPLRIHVLRSGDLPNVQANLTTKDVERVVGKVNAVWHKAGVHWALDPVVREPAARQREFRAAQANDPPFPLRVYKLLMPDATKAPTGVNLYYVHQFPINGAYFFGDRTAVVSEQARVKPIAGGIDEALARVTAHELGHALGLQHRQDKNNLLSSGSSGVVLTEVEVARVRVQAAKFPGVVRADALRRQLDAARGKPDAAEVARLDALLRDLAGPPDRAR